MLGYNDLSELQKLIIDAWMEEGMTVESALSQLEQDLLVAEEEGGERASPVPLSCHRPGEYCGR